MFWRSLLKDSHDGSWSSKRVITFLSFLLISAAFIADQFTIYKANENLFDSVIYLVIAGLGFTATEKFAKKKENINE
jgi:hypothetical protein